MSNYSSVSGRSLRPIIAAVMILCAPGVVEAKVDKKVREEFSPYLEELKKAEDPGAKQAMLIAWGKMADKKEIAEIENFKSDSNPEVRLGAVLGLYLAGKKGSGELVRAELDAQGELFLKMRDRVTVLDDKTEIKLIKELLKKSKEPMTRDIMRYLSSQNGPLFEQLVSFATAKKDTPQRKAAREALLAAGRAETLDVAKKFVGDKKSEATQIEGLALAARIVAVDPSKKSAVAEIFTQASTSTFEKVKLDALRKLATLNEASAVASLLQAAAKAEDAALKIELMGYARKALDAGVIPKIADVKPLLEGDNPEDVVLIQAYQLAAATGDGAVKQKLFEFFKSNTFEERLLAAQALGFTNDSSVVTILGSSLFEGDRRMRLYSARGLKVMAAPAGLKALQTSLTKERDPEVKLAVVQAIGALATPEASRVLKFQTTQRDPKIKLAVIEAVRNQGIADGTKTLKILLSDKNSDIRWRAFLATLELDQKAGEALFGSALRNPPATWLDDLASLSTPRRVAAIGYIASQKSSQNQPMALGYMIANKADFAGQLRDLLLDSSYDEGVRMTILADFAASNVAADKSAIERASRDAKSERLSRMAAWFVVRDATPESEAMLRGMLAKPDEQLRALAVVGLVNLSDSSKGKKKKKR